MKIHFLLALAGFAIGFALPTVSAHILNKRKLEYNS